MPRSSKTVTIPFNLGGRASIIAIDVILENSVRDWTISMALDTGASISTIPTEAARALGHDPTKSHLRTDIIAAGSIQSVPVIRIPRMSFLGFKLHDLEMACLDLPFESSVAGLLGLNVLRKFDVLLGFSKNELSFRSW